MSKAISVKVNVRIDGNEIIRRWSDLLKDEQTMLMVHQALERYCYPYVPMQEGNLFQQVEITSKSVKYTQPYAHYQYTGELYLAANGSSWAKKDEKKYPSGLPLVYSKEKHPKATKEWDKAMMAEDGPKFTQEISDILVRRMHDI